MHHTRRCLIAPLAALIILAVPVGARQGDAGPAFDVVSIKPNRTLNSVMVIRLPPGGVNGVNVTPAMLIRYAYDFALDYTPDAVALDAATAKEFPDIDPAGSALATALREQLGLRWVTQTESVPVLAVVRIEPPEPD